VTVTAEETAAAQVTVAAQRRRYVSDVIALHDRISLRGLASQVRPDSVLYQARRDDGLVVMAVRHDGIPERYLLGIHGFRLAQYLRLQFASERIAFDRALFAEPAGRHANEIHVIALDEPSGTILRYVSLAGTPDPVPMHPRDPDRTLFPCEVVHGVNLFDHVQVDEEIDTSQIWEIKRLVHRGTDTGGLVARLRLTLELMLGFYTALSRVDPPVRVIIGDGEERVAIARLLRSLRDITVVEGTTPSVPEDDLLYPRYAFASREVVKAFVVRVPRGDELHQLVEHLERALANPNPLAGFKELVGQVGGQLRRVHI
jgi:hypothetical protein